MSVLKGEGTHTILYGPVDIFTGLRHTRGYLARPDEGGAHDTVLLLHGEGGITSSEKSLARRLARHGMAVIAPDLYRGQQPRLAGKQGHREILSNWPDRRQLLSDVRETFLFIASLDTPWVRAGALGVLAFGSAAATSLAFTAKEPTVHGVVLVSPAGAGLDDGLVPIAAPVLGFLGKDDPEAHSHQRLQNMLPHGEWVRYGGVGAGVLDEGAADYQWQVAEDAFTRMLVFFGAVYAR